MKLNFNPNAMLGNSDTVKTLMQGMNLAQELRARSLLNNPQASMQDYKQAMLLSSPENAEKIRQTLSFMPQEKVKNSLKDSSNIALALHLGDGKRGAMMMRNYAQKLRADGEFEDADFFEKHSNEAENNPEQIGSYLSGMISFLPGGKEVLDNILKLTEERRKRDVGAVDLQKKTIDARYAEPQALSDLQKNFLENKKLGIDLQYKAPMLEQELQNKKIDAMYAEPLYQAKLAKDRLEAQSKTDAKAQKLAMVLDNLSLAESNVNDLKNDNFYKEEIKSLPSSTPGVLVDYLGPKYSPKRKALEAKLRSAVASLKQLKISDMQGLGSLSDAEGKDLGAIIASLNDGMHPSRLLKEINKAQAYIAKSKKNIARQAHAQELNEELMHYRNNFYNKD